MKTQFDHQVIPISIWADIRAQTDQQVWSKWSVMTGKLQEIAFAQVAEPVWQDISRNTFAKTLPTLIQASTIIKAGMSDESSS